MERSCDRYLDHLRVERNLSPSTLTAYGTDLAEMRAMLAQWGLTRPDEVMPEHIYRWQRSLAGRGLAAASQSRALTSARRYFLFLVREGDLERTPLADAMGPKLPKRLPTVLSEREATQLLERDCEDTPAALRDRAALELLYATGMRVSELCSLDMGDVDLKRNVVQVMGKGRRERLIPMGEPACLALNIYVGRARRTLLRGKQAKYLFVGDRGGRLGRAVLYKIVRREALSAGVATPASPHKLRHAFATHLLRRGADLRSVQELLGHVNVTTTEVYTHLAPDQLRRTVEQHHPLGGIGAGAAQGALATSPRLPPEGRGGDG